MKTRDLWTGVGFVVVGILFLLAALLWETPLGSLFCGLCGAFTVPGIAQIIKYIKWSSPKHRDEYQARLEQEQIELRDERKEMLRNKSGRIAYILGLLLAAVSMTVFSFLGKLGFVDQAASRLVILFLAGYMLVQILAGMVIYRVIERRY